MIPPAQLMKQGRALCSAGLRSGNVFSFVSLSQSKACNAYLASGSAWMPVVLALTGGSAGTFTNTSVPRTKLSMLARNTITLEYLHYRGAVGSAPCRQHGGRARDAHSLHPASHGQEPAFHHRSRFHPWRERLIDNFICGGKVIVSVSHIIRKLTWNKDKPGRKY